MKKHNINSIRICSLFILITAGTSNLFAQPANDDCASAIAIACGETLSGTTIDGVADPVGFCGTDATASGVFYTFTGTGEDIIVSLCSNTDYDSKLSIFEGDCDSLICVGGNDDNFACTPASEVSFASDSGTVYFFYVHGFSANVGNFDISVTCTPVSPAPANDDCANALPILCGESLAGTTTGATIDGASDCGGATVSAPGVWYSFIGDGNIATVSTCNTAAYDTKIGIYADGCGTLTCITGNDDGTGCSGFTSEATFPTTAGTEYLILVHGFSSETGDFTLTVSCQGSAANDNCADAIAVTCGEVVSGSTIGATEDNAGTCGATNTAPGVWYSFTGTGDFITVSTCNAANFDTKISVFTGTCGALTCVGGNDDGAGCAGFTSSFGFASDAGTEYLILVHGFLTETGDFDLSLSCAAPVDNDNCSDVTPVELTNGTPVTFTGTTIGGTASAEETAVLGAAAVWEAVTLTGECNNLTVSYCGTPLGVMDYFFVVYTDCPLTTFTPGLADLTACADGNGTAIFYDLPAGTYYLPVLADPAFITQGDFTMTVLSEDCPPPPLNDSCHNAIEIACNETLSGTTVSATLDDADSCATANTAPGVWYSFTGTGDFVTVSTCNAANFDTKISVFTGTCGALTCVGDNDDGPGCLLFTSQLGFVSEAGTKYLILVHGFDVAFGDFDLTVSCQPIILPNDLCSGALPIACGDVVTGSTGLATPEAAAPCIVPNTSAGVWYRLTGTDQLVTATTCNAGNLFDTKISVYTGTCDSLICVNGNDDDFSCLFDPFFSTVSWIAMAGTDYYILVHGFSADTGTFELSITCTEPLANDDCSFVTPVELTNGTPVTFTGSTVGGTSSAEEIAILGAAAVWEAVTLTGECNNLTVDYCGTSLDVMAYFFIVYTGCPVTEFTFGTSDLLGCPDGNGTVHFFNLPAGTYYLPVLADPAFVVQGDYIMNVSSVDCPPPPPNDDVCDAQELTLGDSTAFTNVSASVEDGEVSPGPGSAAGASCLSQDGWCLLDTAVQSSVWFYFTAPASGHVSVTSGTFDAQIAVYSVGDCEDFSTFTEVSANDDSSPFCDFCPFVQVSCLIPGQTYYVQLDGFNGLFDSGTIIVQDLGLANIVSGYTLVNSSTDADVAPLLEGDIINLRTLPKFNIRADFCRPIGSAMFDLNGTPFNTENIAPYAAGGDNPTGNYHQFALTPGSYQMLTSPYNGPNGSGGLSGLADTINFTVVDDDCVPAVILITTDLFAEETSFEFEDLTTGTIISSAAAGTLVSNSTLRQVFCLDPNHCYEFRIFDVFGDGICCAFGAGSYSVTFGGITVASGGAFAFEEITNFGGCDLDCAGTPGGSLVTDVNGDCCEASELDCEGVCFGGNTTGRAVTSFTLVNAATDLDIGPLNDGDIINLALTGPISVRANVCNDANVESVKFLVNGSLFKIENLVFYSIAGDNSGNYAAWNVAPGTYTINATPYSGDAGSGTAGLSHEVTVTVVGTPKTDPHAAAAGNAGEISIAAYPNPFKEFLTFEFSVPYDSHVTLELFSISGVKVATVFEGKVAGDAVNKQIFHPGELASGLYMYRLKTNDSVVFNRIALTR